MDKKRGRKGSGFEKYFGGKGNRPQGSRAYGDSPHGGAPRDDRPKGDRPYAKPRDDRQQGQYTRGKPEDGRRYYEKDGREGGKRPGDRGANPGGDRPQRPFREDGRAGKGPGPRFSRAPERPVPPAVYEGGERMKPQAPRYGRPAERDGADRPAPRYGRPAPRFDRPGARFESPAPPQERSEAEESGMDNLLVGRNPIREALKAGRPIEKMLVAQGELSGSAKEIVAKAREAGIVVQFVDRARLDAVYPNHQGMLAYASAASYASVEDILALAASRDEAPFVVVLDGVTDPHNLGAIIRSAECCGAHGVIVPERRSAGLNPAAVKASAGALSYLLVAKVGNLSRTLSELKEKGLWVIGCDMSGGDIQKADLSGPVALVVGSEGEGISHLVLEGCDKVVSIPLKGQIESLNASVAAGIALYEVMRARSGQ